MPKIGIKITPVEYETLSHKLQSIWTGRANPETDGTALFQIVFEYVNELVQEAFQRGKQIGTD